MLVSGANESVMLNWSDNFNPKWQGRFDAAQVFVDNEVLKLNARYIPFQTGFLNRSGILGTDVGSGRIVYNAPYARHMYYGKVMRDDSGKAFYGGAPKHVTDEEINYHGAPQRGALWFERMKENHKEQILRGASKLMK
ncbi:MAG: minor capsid protein [Bacteroidaceae bacterium]|nr:minor capsid protein [Bacteroidaceae bacterium]